MSIFNLLQQGVESAKKAYNTLDEHVLGGLGPGGPAAKIKGNTAPLNGVLHTFNGKKWIPHSEWQEQQENKIGHEQAQAVRDTITKFNENPYVQVGHQINDFVLQHSFPLAKKNPITGQTPIETISKATDLIITQPLSSIFNVDPLWVDLAISLASGKPKGLGKFKLPTRLRTVNRFALPSGYQPRLPAKAQQIIDLTKDSSGSYRAGPLYGAGLAINPTELATTMQSAASLLKPVAAANLLKLASSTGILSDIATSHRITPEGVKKVYGTTKLGKRVLGSDAHGGMHSPVFHHIIGKKIRLRFLQRMEHLNPKTGKGRLEALDRKYNLQAGSGDDAGLTMDQQAHGPHHDASRLGGIEPWDTKKDKTLSKLKKLIDNATSTKDLELLYEEYLKYSVIPDLDHALRYQRGFEILGSPKGGVDKTLLKETAHEWGDRMLDIGSVKDDIYWDDLHKTAIEEANLLNSNRYNQ